MIVALLSEKGGVSKSTLALGLAWEWMLRGLRVLLVDADPAATCLEAAQEAQANGHQPPTTIQKGKELHGENQIPLLAKGFDHVVIDTPGGDARRLQEIAQVQRAAMAVADVVLMPVSPSGPDAWRAMKTVPILREAQGLWPDLRAAMVVTRRISRSTLGEQARAQLLEHGLPVFKASTYNRTSWAEASTAGLGVTRYAPSSKAAEELRAVLAELEAFNQGAERG